MPISLCVVCTWHTEKGRKARGNPGAEVERRKALEVRRSNTLHYPIRSAMGKGFGEIQQREGSSGKAYLSRPFG